MPLPVLDTHAMQYLQYLSQYFAPSDVAALPRLPRAASGPAKNVRQIWVTTVVVFVTTVVAICDDCRHSSIGRVRAPVPGIALDVVEPSPTGCRTSSAHPDAAFATISKLPKPTPNPISKPTGDKHPARKKNEAPTNPAARLVRLMG